MTVFQSPNVLVLHLKRFAFGAFSGKISKHVDFETSLALPCSGEDRKHVDYDLVGMIVHHGHSVHSGHYVAFVKVIIQCMM